MNKFKEGDVVEIITDIYERKGDIFKITQFFHEYNGKNRYSTFGIEIYYEDELRLVEEKQFNFDIL